VGTSFRSRKTIKPVLLCAALFGLAGYFEAASQPVGVAQGYLMAKVSGNQALSVAAGEFRVVAANLLWSKVVDHYHHVWIAQGGDWSKNITLLPLLRTITELDPHFTQAYQLEGGTILPRTGHLAQGQAVLAEGIRNNPNSWEMYREMAMLYAWTEHKPKLALPYAQKGLQCADDGFSRNLLTLLCHTLHDQIQHGTPVTASGHPPTAPAARVSSAAPALHPPATG
jgi:hypothetical protein